MGFLALRIEPYGGSTDENASIDPDILTGIRFHGASRSRQSYSNLIRIGLVATVEYWRKVKPTRHHDGNPQILNKIMHLIFAGSVNNIVF